MQKVDVIVLGAGISGCIAAALLAKQGYQVAIVSRDAGTEHHLPESWIFSIPDNLHFLGLEKHLLPALHPCSRTVFCSADGAHEIGISAAQNGGLSKGDLVLVDRNQFDRLLLSRTLELGALFYPERQILDCHFSSSDVRILAQHQHSEEEITASFMIDATGKTAFLANRFQLPIQERKLDHRIACFSHFEIPTALCEMRIVAQEYGYFFCIPLTANRISIGCVVSEDKADPAGSYEALFISRIEQSPYVKKLIENGRRVLPVIPAKNHQRICLMPASNRFRLVGDAAAFLDPFFCPGIDFAFYSASLAVETMNQAANLYTDPLLKWLDQSQLSLFENLEQSQWQKVLKLFADPHLPFPISLMLTQAFGRVIDKDLSFSRGIQIARGSYEMASH